MHACSVISDLNPFSTRGLLGDYNVHGFKFKFPLYNEPIYIYRFEVQKGGIFLKLYKTYKYI